MTKQEIEKRVEEIEDKMWWIKMKSRWTYEDSCRMDKLLAERNELLRKSREM